MLDFYTEQAGEVLSLAMHEARTAGRTELQVCDLVKGLAYVWPELGQALGFSVDRSQAERKIARSYGGGWSVTFGKRLIWGNPCYTFNEAYNKVMQRAAELAEQALTRRIAIREILLALAHVDPAVADLLGQKNVDPELFPLPKSECRGQLHR